MFQKALTSLNSGDLLVYATCSILKDENERLIEKYISKGLVEVVPIEKEKFKDLKVLNSLIEGVITVLPDQYYEGFFVASLRKK